MPRHFAACLAAVIVVSSLAAMAGAQPAEPEFRTMWATRFDWPDPNEAVCKARIDSIMADLAASNFNAVLFQVRGQADTLYPSPNEVWSPLIGGEDPGWDPLAYAIAAAHANGIEFHAYINTHTCWNSPEHLPPEDPNHLYWQHCDPDNPDARDWLVHDAQGEPGRWMDNYIWIAPGVPAFQAYIRQQILYVVENYDVDGVHFDRIRTPNSSYSYDPLSLARFNDVQSNPEGLDFGPWTTDQVTRLARDIYAAIMAVKPQVKVSAAVFPNAASAAISVNQDALTWIQTGGMDFLVPMLYSGGGAGSSWETYLLQYLAGIGDRQLVAGLGAGNGADTIVEQIELTRLHGGHGNSVFAWSESFDLWDDYLARIYQQPANPPAMDWKDNPTTAIIYGYISDAADELVADAQISRSSRSYTALSTGDGFYALLLVPPGTYTVTASHRAYGSASVNDVTLAAGDVLRQDIALGSLLPPIIDEVTPDPLDQYENIECTRRLTLTQGSADSWELLEGPPGATIDAYGLVSGWWPTEDDVGQSFPYSVRATNTAGSDTESWSVTVIADPPMYSFSLVIDEGGTGSCDYETGWEWVGVTGVSGWAPQGQPIFTSDGVWQTIDVPLDDDNLILPCLGGDGQLLASPTGYYTIDTLWFTITPGFNEAGLGPHEVLIDSVELLDAAGQTTETILSMEDGVNRLSYARGQSPNSADVSQLTDDSSYDGNSSHHLGWTWDSTGPGESLGMLQRLGWACGTSELIADSTATLRFHLVCREQPMNPSVPLPLVPGPLVGQQDAVRIVNDASATAVQLYVNGVAYGDPVTPTGGQTDLFDVTLTPGDSVSAAQELPDVGFSDLAYPRAVTAVPPAPRVVEPLWPELTSVEVTAVSMTPHATAELVSVWVNGILRGETIPGGETVLVDVDTGLASGDVVSATQTVNGATSPESEPVTVVYPAPVIYKAPAEGDALVTVMNLPPAVGTITLTVNDVPAFTAVPDPGRDRWDMPVNGLVAGDVVHAYYTVGVIDSVLSEYEIVTTNVTSEILCDDFEYDQSTYEANWADSGSTDRLELVTLPNGDTCLYAPSGTTRVESNIPPTIPSEVEPLVFNVNIYDPIGFDPGGLCNQWAQIIADGMDDLFYMHVGILGWSNTDNVHYDFRAVFNGGPNWVDLDEHDGPERNVGWHVFTVAHKGNRIDVYVDELLALKNLPLSDPTTYAIARIGSGYDSAAEAYYDDYCIELGPVHFNKLPPHEPTLAAPLEDGDEAVTVTDVESSVMLVEILDEAESVIGSYTGPIAPSGEVCVALDRPLTALEAIAARVSHSGGWAMSPPLEVGRGNGDLLICLGIRETGDSGPLGSPGSTMGPMEWIGASIIVDGAPQGTNVEPLDSWQTLVFDPQLGPVQPFTGNGMIDGERGTIEHLAVTVDADSTGRSSGAYRLYVDNVVNTSAGAGGSDFVIADFEGFAPGSEVLFQEPTHSGTTDQHLTETPSESLVTAAAGNPGHAAALIWFFRDTTTRRWVRITTADVDEVPSPIIDLTKPIRMDILLEEVIAGCPRPGGSRKFCLADIYPNNADGLWDSEIDGDCFVDLDDLAQILGNYGLTSGASREDGDVFPAPDGDGRVNLDDLAELLGQYGDACN